MSVKWALDQAQRVFACLPLVTVFAVFTKHHLVWRKRHFLFLLAPELCSHECSGLQHLFCNTCSYKAFVLEWVKDQFLMNVMYWPWQTCYVHLETNLVCKAFERGLHNDVPVVDPVHVMAWARLAVELTCSVCHPTGKPFGEAAYRWRVKNYPLCMAFPFLKSIVVSLAKLGHFCLWPSNENCWINWGGFIWSDFFLPCVFNLSAVCWKLT